VSKREGGFVFAPVLGLFLLPAVTAGDLGTSLNASYGAGQPSRHPMEPGRAGGGEFYTYFTLLYEAHTVSVLGFFTMFVVASCGVVLILSSVAAADRASNLSLIGSTRGSSRETRSVGVHRLGGRSWVRRGTRV